MPLVTSLAPHWNILGMVDGEPDLPSGSQSYSQRLAHLKAATAAVEREVMVTNLFAAVTGRMSAQRDMRADATFISADTLTDGSTALAIAPPKPALRTRTKTVGFQLLAGSTVDMLEALRWGANGAMPAFGACAPQGCYEVLAAWKDGDLPLAKEKQVKIQQAAEKIEVELGSAGIRYGCDLNGYFGGRPRLPFLPVTGEQRAEIEGLMRTIRN